MSTEISNITAVEFNATAFSSAVIDVAAAVVPVPALPSLRVVLTNDPSVTVTTTKSNSRRLQAAPNSVTVAYDVRNLPDAAAATALQQRLTSADGNAGLLNSYKALSDTAATAATTTAIKAPVVPPVHTATATAAAPVGIIAGSVVGGVVVLVAAAALAVCCQKRRVATRRRELLRKAVADDRAALYSSNNSSSSSKFSSSNSFRSGSTTTAAARDPLRHSYARNSDSMLQAIDSDSASEHNNIASVTAGCATHDVEQGVHAPIATVGSSTQQPQQQTAPTSASSTATTSHSSTSGAGGTVRFAVAPPAATTATAANVSGAAANQMQLATKQAWTRRLSTRVTSAARHGIREHGEKAVVAWEGIGSGSVT
jgi:hypothetical protein